MRLILTGIEYSGTTTLGKAIGTWFESAAGVTYGFHDHFKIPHISHGEFTAEEQQSILDLSPRLKETIQRHQLSYHVQPTFYLSPDLGVIGLHIEDAVYGPLYWGYGGAGATGDRRTVSEETEAWIMEAAPQTCLVLLKASSDVIAARMERDPRENSPLRLDDIDHVLQRFEEEYAGSILPNKFTLDTGTATVEETLADFVERIEPYLEESDRLRIELQKTKPGSG